MRLRVARVNPPCRQELPVECVRAAGLQEGDTVEAEITPAGEITLTPASPFDRAAFLERVQKLHSSMQMTEPVVEQMRREARY